MALTVMMVWYLSRNNTHCALAPTVRLCPNGNVTCSGEPLDNNNNSLNCCSSSNNNSTTVSVQQNLVDSTVYRTCWVPVAGISTNYQVSARIQRGIRL